RRRHGCCSRTRPEPAGRSGGRSTSSRRCTRPWIGIPASGSASTRATCGCPGATSRIPPPSTRCSTSSTSGSDSTGCALCTSTTRTLRSSRTVTAMRTSSKASSARSSASSSATRGCRACRRCWRSRAPTTTARTPASCASCASSMRAAWPLAQLREDAEGRPAERELGELGVDAAELAAPVVVRLLDLDAAHRQRLALRPDRAEAAAAPLGLAQEVDVDLDVVHLLHAADVRVSELLVRVDERTRTVDAGGGVDDLVAVHPAPPALDLVLRAERERLGRGAAELH